jgi:oligopeptide transport system substrate-binding protein
MKKKLAALALVFAMGLSLAACGGGSASTETTNAAEAAGSSLAVCLASEPDTLDPALNAAVDGATMLIHLFSGLAKWEQNTSGDLRIVPDAAEALTEGVVNDDGTITYTYILRDGMTWSDGQPVTANDYVFAWQRAASTALAADYSYMFEVVDGYDAIWETDADGNYVNPDARLNVQALDDKTIQITLANPIPYWNELLAFPAYFPVREDVVSNDAWATDPATYVCNGPYTMSDWSHNSVITLTKNPNYYDADNVTMDTIRCFLSDDTNNMLTNFKNGDWNFIEEVPPNEIAALKDQYPDEYQVVGQIGTYYVCWNVNVDILPADSGLTGTEAEQARAEIRQAVGLLLDRNYIVEAIAQGGQLPASSFVAMGMTDADGSEFYQNAGHNDSFYGYYDVSADALQSNYDAAMETLKKYYDFDEAAGKFTNFPSMTYLYNTNENHKAIGEYIQSALDGVGISLSLENQEWNTFLNTRRVGDYFIARNGWVADYNDPICFLDRWISGSGNNDVQFGRDAHKDLAMYSIDLTPYGLDTKVDNGTWAESYDVLISAIKSCADDADRYAMMHDAEDLLMSTGCITPIYFCTDQFMLDNRVQGFFSNPLGFKYFMYCTFDGE